MVDGLLTLARFVPLIVVTLFATSVAAFLVENRRHARRIIVTNYGSVLLLVLIVLLVGLWWG
jgi:putative copper export protein